MNKVGEIGRRLWGMGVVLVSVLVGVNSFGGVNGRYAPPRS